MMSRSCLNSGENYSARQSSDRTNENPSSSGTQKQTAGWCWELRSYVLSALSDKSAPAVTQFENPSLNGGENYSARAVEWLKKWETKFKWHTETNCWVVLRIEILWTVHVVHSAALTDVVSCTRMIICPNSVGYWGLRSCKLSTLSTVHTLTHVDSFTRTLAQTNPLLVLGIGVM